MTGRITADEEGTSNDMIRMWEEHCVWYKWVFNKRNRCTWKVKPRRLGLSVSRPQQRNFPLWIGTVDDMASQNRHAYNLPLQAASVKCKACAEDSRTALLFTIRALSRYIASKRSDARVVWKYAQCRNGYLKLHVTECHIPKCKVVYEMPQAFA
jgi:hypothetical protein